MKIERAGRSYELTDAGVSVSVITDTPRGLRWVSVGDASRIADVQPRQIYRAIDAGSLTCRRIGKGVGRTPSVFVPYEELLAWNATRLAYIGRRKRSYAEQPIVPPQTSPEAALRARRKKYRTARARNEAP